MIQHKNFDQILLNSSQEPSTSSKYEHILDAILIMLGSWKSSYNSRLTWNVDLWCKIWYPIWPNPPKLHSGTINILHLGLRSWCTNNHSMELNIWKELKTKKLCWFIMSYLISEMIQSSKSSVRNHQHPPSMTVFLCTFNHASRELKLGIQLNNDIQCLFVMSNLIPNMYD